MFLSSVATLTKGRVSNRAMRDFVYSGRREWDRTTDHFHVKEVLYH